MCARTNARHVPQQDDDDKEFAGRSRALGGVGVLTARGPAALGGKGLLLLRM